MRTCGGCKHLSVRDWQLTHGTCEWVDSTDEIPVWLEAHPTRPINDPVKCGTWTPKDDDHQFT